MKILIYQIKIITSGHMDIIHVSIILIVLLFFIGRASSNERLNSSILRIYF